MNDIVLNSLLKSVSRSFYLSMRVLPHAMRKSISLAYLLARAADSIADTNQISREQRELLLNKFRSLLLINLEQRSLDKLIAVVAAKLENKNEVFLIRSLQTIFLAVAALPRNDYLAVSHVVDVLTQGMQIDLSTFDATQSIIALDDQKALDVYTYYVAGCVGEFWTRQSMRYVSSVSVLEQKSFHIWGLEFGKALQLTNIVRDVAKDARLGRCYLPQTWLDERELTTNDLLNLANDEKFRPVIQQVIAQALAYFSSAEQYLLALPRFEIRLRLAALWPILIGLKTLELVANKANFLDPSISIKVSRKWVYRMLLASSLSVCSNARLKKQIHRFRKNILQEGIDSN